MTTTSTTAEQTTIDDLPVEMVCEVTRELNMQDLVRLKMTSKRYLEIVNDFGQVKKLEVSPCKMPTAYSVDHCEPNLFLVQVTKPTLSHLQHLSIDERLQHFDLDLNKLNHLTRLVYLKLGYELKEASQVCLSLSDLRDLEIIANRNCVMSIKSTKLQKLTYYGEAGFLHVEHPETVVTLNTDLPAERLKSFQNVRYLLSSSNLAILSERTLLDLPDLKEIAYTGSYDDVFEAFGQDGPSAFLEVFMHEKKVLRRTNLKVRFVSLELVDHKPISEYIFDKFFSDYYDRSYVSFDELYLHAHNYDQLIGTFSFHFENLDYGQIMHLFDSRIPDDFFAKFVDIGEVEISFSRDEEQRLLGFLSSVPQLSSLKLHEASLSESFFHRLSESCSNTLQSLIKDL